MPWDQCGSGQGRQCLAVCLSLHVAARCILSHQMQTDTCAHQGKKRGMQLSFSARKLSEKINWCTVYSLYTYTHICVRIASSIFSIFVSREAFCRISLKIQTVVLSPCFTSLLSNLVFHLLTEVLLCFPALHFHCCLQWVPYELITVHPAPWVHALCGLLVNLGSLCWLRGSGATT